MIGLAAGFESVPFVASGETVDWARGLVGLLLGATGIVLGVLAWGGRFPGTSGPRPRYRTFYGGAHVGVLFGAGFVLVSGGELVRGLAGADRNGGFFVAVSVLALAAWLIGAVYFLAYYLVGVPDSLRPPHQRGDRSDRPT